MLKKTVLVVFITAFLVLQGFYIKCKNLELQDTKQSIELLFGKHYKSTNCDKDFGSFNRSRTQYIKFHVTGVHDTDRQKVLKDFSEDLPKFFTRFCSKIDSPETCILVWCTPPTISFANGEYYGETLGFVILSLSSMFVLKENEEKNIAY